MKLLVVLVLVSVSNANILWQEPPKSNLDVVKAAFWDYVAKATQTAEDSLKQIRESELGQEVNMKISQSTDTVNQYISSLRTQAAPLTQDFLTRFTQEAEQLKARLENDLTSLGSNVRPYGEQLVAKLQTQLEELKKEATPYAEAVDVEALKAVLQRKSQDLRAQLVPYTEEVREKMEQSLEEFQRSVMPLARGFESQVVQKTQEIQQGLVPYGEELKARLDTGAQDLQAQLATLWESFTQKNQ